jgi:hypothetical protein
LICHQQTQANRRTFTVADPVLWENLKQQIDLIGNDINALQEEKALKKQRYNDAKNKLNEAKDDEGKYIKTSGKAQRGIVSRIESIFAKNYTEKPYHHR